MAFPQVQSVTPTTTSSATVHNVNMPSTVNAGDLLLLLVRTGAGSVNSNPSGWSLLLDNSQSPVYVKRAIGDEGGSTVALGTSINANVAAQVYRVTDWYDSGTILQDVEIGTVTGTSTTPDPPALNPANWGAEDTLWVAVMAFGGNTNITSYPASYVGGVQIVTGGGSGATVGSAYRENNTASEDPGSFTKAGSSSWRAHTIAIRPADPPILFDGSAEVSFDGTVNVDAVSDIVFTGSGALDFDGTAQVTQIAVMDGAEEVSFDGTVVLSGGALLLVGDGDVSFDGSVSLNQDAVFEGFGDVTMNGLASLGVIREFVASQSVSFDGSANLTAIGWQEVDIASSQIWTVKK